VNLKKYPLDIQLEMPSQLVEPGIPHVAERANVIREDRYPERFACLIHENLVFLKFDQAKIVAFLQLPVVSAATRFKKNPCM
jgi:hypothetical protein